MVFQANYTLRVWQGYGKNRALRIRRCCSSGVEHVLGKDGVVGSIPISSTIFPKYLTIFVFSDRITAVTRVMCVAYRRAESAVRQAIVGALPSEDVCLLPDLKLRAELSSGRGLNFTHQWGSHDRTVLVFSCAGRCYTKAKHGPAFLS